MYSIYLRIVSKDQTIEPQRAEIHQIYFDCVWQYMEVSIYGGRTHCQYFLFQKLKEILTWYSRTILKDSKN